MSNCITSHFPTVPYLWLHLPRTRDLLREDPLARDHDSVFLRDALLSVQSSILRPLETHKVKYYRVQAFLSHPLRAGNVVDMYADRIRTKEGGSFADIRSSRRCRSSTRF